MKFIKKRSKAYLQTFQMAEAIEFLQSGINYYEKLISVIDSAKESLHLQMYIIYDDEIGNRILIALIQAARRGVEIYVVADGFGSRNLSELYIEKLNNAGINFRFFSRISLIKNLSIGRRLHHKVVVVDEKYALVGGLNIANRIAQSISSEVMRALIIFQERP